MEAGLSFAFLGWVELAGVATILMVLFGARWLPWIMRGMGHGIHEVGRATREVSEGLNRPPETSGLVYEAITHDNRTAEFVYSHHLGPAKVRRAMILFFAQGFGTGRIPFAPGTFGSLVGLLWFAVLLATKRYEFYLFGALCGVGLSVWFCGAAEKILRQKDPSSVVLDEIIAIPFCFLPWVTTDWLTAGKLPALETFFTGRGLLGASAIFVLFRLFDIWKPWPVRQSQHLPGGWGVTMDDVLAAAYIAVLSWVFILIF